ncbi:hypothetical protein ACFC25_04185 [Pseudarthrobacter sp. NPDC055928]|uniref:hypothetical protein n=1 Tax=Pseudarthrobacter sp. NPDC055928 TaxID=3345661 RepID=UPI0035E20164
MNENAERVELTDIIASNRNEYADKTADRILAAGYRKPRTITTVEELDALPVESAVLSDMGNVYIKDIDLDDPTAIWWVTAGAVSEFPSIAITLPATILWEPAT